MRRDNDETRRRVETSLALARKVGRPDIAAQSQAHLGTRAAVAGDPRSALRLLEEATAFFRQDGDRLHLADALVSIAIAHRLLAQPQLARRAYMEALGLSTESRNMPGIGSGLLVGAAVESAGGQHLAAVRMMAAAVALSETFGASSPEMPALRNEVEEAARQALGSVAVEHALALGRRLTPDEVVEYAASIGT
ncbi:MAG TPA: hypothetical protein VIM30_06670 [Candidatus Limnocylindrales bacterium]|jgi:tetratricopeptide (TPR) repeat protein